MKKIVRIVAILGCIGLVSMIAIFVWYGILCNDPERLKVEEPLYPTPPKDKTWIKVASGNKSITNPLKGFMPYEGYYEDFPYSMEYGYFSMRSVNPSSGVFNFSNIEMKLNQVAGRGHQMVFRLYLDYPGSPTGIPQYLIDAGVEIRNYTAEGGGSSPNYDDPRVINACVQMIQALGHQYDGDPRIGFIQAGIIGHWGEWHTWPDEEWMANATTQHRILLAYNETFKYTRILVRYPTEITIQYPFGYHDDSFAYGTLDDPHSEDDDWYFWVAMTEMKNTDCWKTVPIGGEVRPEIQASVFYCPRTEGQDFTECVTTTHASWMLMTAVFHPDTYGHGSMSSNDLIRAQAASQLMGYDFKICWFNWTQEKNQINLSVIVSNFGVAPFYYNWSTQAALLDSEEKIIAQINSTNSIMNILPNQSLQWNYTFNTSTQLTNPMFRLRVVNPLTTGMPVLFSNQDCRSDGWLYLKFTAD